MVALCAGDFFEPVGNIRLCSDIEIHIGIYGEAVPALHADTPPFAVRQHKPSVDPKAVTFADGALNASQAPFDFFGGKPRHNQFSRFVYSL